METTVWHKIARLQAAHPYKTYAELCAMVAQRPRKVLRIAAPLVPEKKSAFWWNSD